MLRLAYLIQRANQSVFFLLTLMATGVFFVMAWKMSLDLFYKGLWAALWVAGLILFLEILCWLIATYAKDTDNYTVLEGKKVRKKNKDGLVMHLSGDLVAGDGFDDAGGMDGGDGD